MLLLVHCKCFDNAIMDKYDKKEDWKLPICSWEMSMCDSEVPTGTGVNWDLPVLTQLFCQNNALWDIGSSQNSILIML